MSFLTQQVCLVAHVIRRWWVMKSSGSNPVKLRFEQNSSNPHKEVKIAWLHQQMHFVSLLHLLTLSGRFRVGFGVGDISNTINIRALTFSDTHRIFELWTTAILTWSNLTQLYMYVYMLMHYKSSCTVPQPAAWLTMFLSAHVQYLCEAFA